MGVSKVEFGGETLIDLTGDTVTSETMVKGVTAHNKAGEPIEGTFDPTIYQTKTDETLETESKEVVGAINEVSGRVDNSISRFSVSTGPYTLVISVKAAIEEAGGDISKYNYVQLTGYLNRLLMMSFAFAGGNNYTVTCTDPINGYRLNTYNASTVIDITTTTVRELVELVVGDIPSYNEENNGQFLSVVNGNASWVALPVAEDIVITIAEEITFNE